MFDEFNQPDFIERLKEKDRDAWEKLVIGMNSVLVGIVLKKVASNYDDAQSSVDLGLAKAHKGIWQYDEKKTKLTTWIVQIALNTAIDDMRAQLRQQGWPKKSHKKSTKEIASEEQDKTTNLQESETNYQQDTRMKYSSKDPGSITGSYSNQESGNISDSSAWVGASGLPEFAVLYEIKEAFSSLSKADQNILLYELSNKSDYEISNDENIPYEIVRKRRERAKIKFFKNYAPERLKRKKVQEKEKKHE